MTAELRIVIAYLLMTGGVFFSFASVVGIIRFPDVYTRIHAGTKALTGGAFLILAGAAFYAPTWQISARLFLIAAFLMGTNPIASHAISRACYRHGIKPELAYIDEYEDVQEGVNSK
ncbi:MAG: monovalent cation/H(+) antiporter subunit G [Thermovirgaceae bacterium]|nr:monovalent cation/H(+) antiporter subunit G [Thermovirgaceae bacterium]